MKRKISILLIAALTGTLLFTGCKKSENSDKTSAEATATPDEAPTETPEPGEAVNEPEAPADIEAVDEPAVPEDELVFAGEGTSETTPGTVITPAGDSTYMKLGEPLIIQENGQDCYSITIDSMELTNERSEHEGDADQVLKVVYTYKNLKMNQELLIDDIWFHLADENNTVCAPYYLSSADQQAVLVTGDTPCTAAVAFEVNGDAGKATLYFTDILAETTPKYVLTPGD